MPRSQNALKFATQPSAAVAGNTSEMIAGVTTAAPAEKEESQRLTRYTQQSRFVNGRAFFQNGNQWVDANAQNLTRQTRIRFNSEEYFDLLKKHPETAQWLALGRNMLLAVGDMVYEIFE